MTQFRFLAKQGNRVIIQKQNKYRNKKTVVDGIVFDSKAEALKYRELKLLLLAGEIKQLRRQVEYPLMVNGEKVGTYRSDFDYVTKDGRRVVYDVKGYKTDVYQLKKRIMKACWGIDIVESPRRLSKRARRPRILTLRGQGSTQATDCGGG